MTEKGMFSDQIKVLIVDHAPGSRKALSELMRRTGYAVLQGTTGPECFDQAKKNGPDLILLGSMFPSGAGQAFCCRIKSDPDLENCIVVQVNGSGVSEKDRVLILEAGADASIDLSINDDELLARVKALIRVQQREKKLRISEQKHREMVENANSIVLRMDFQGQVSFINRFAQNFFGFPEDEIIGRNVVGTIVPKTESSGRDLEAMILDIGRNPGQYKNNENENIKKDGSRVWISWTNNPVCSRDNTVQEILCIGNDITDRKQAEEELRTAEQYLENTIESSNDAIVITNKLGIIKKANRYFCDMVGRSREEVLGKKGTDYAPEQKGCYVTTAEDSVQIDEKFFDECREVIEAFLAKGTLDNWETYLIRSDGNLVPVEFNSVFMFDRQGNPQDTVAIIRDISERRRAEKRLVEEKTLLQSINRILRDTLTCDTIEDVAKTCIAVAENLTASSFGCIVEVSDSGVMESLVMSDSGWGTFSVSRSETDTFLSDMPIRGAWRTVLDTEKSLIDNHPVSAAHQDSYPPGHPEFDTFLGVPLRYEDKTFGLIVLGNKASGYTENDRIMIEELSTAFAEALQRKKSQKELQDARDELEARVLQRTAELKKTKDFLSDILESSLDCIVVSDNTGYLRQTNSAFLNLLGFEENEVIGRHLSEFGPQKKGVYQSLTGESITIGDELFNTAVEKIAQLLKEGKTSRWETYLMCKDRRLVPAEHTIMSIYNAEGKKNGAVGILRDITERKKSEMEIEKAKNFLEKVFSSTGDGLVVLDKKGVILEVNDTAQKMLGYAHGELVGRKYKSFISQNYSPNVFFEKWTKDGYSDNHEVVCKRKNGSEVPLEVNIRAFYDNSGSVTGWVGSIRDITQRKMSEAALSTSEARYRLTTDHIPLHLGYVDCSNRYKLWNKYSEKMLGYSADEVLERMTPADVHESKAEADAVIRIATEKGVYDSEVRLRHKNGFLVPVHLVVVPQRKDETGEVVGFYGFAEDISMRKKNEEDLLRYQGKLRMLASELALAEERERKEIAQGLHDQIGTTLSAIKLDLKRITKKINPECREGLCDIETSINSIISQVQNLTLEVSPLLLYTGGLLPAVEELGEMFGARYGFAFRLHSPGSLPDLQDDVRSVLYRSIRELLHNVVKHANARNVEVIFSVTDKAYTVSVADDGKGFEPSSQMARKAQKTITYGLFSIRERMNCLAGSVSIVSKIGNGTRISLKIPLPRAGAAA